MLRESSTSLLYLPTSDVVSILDKVMSCQVTCYPIRKSAKVFCRLSSEGLFTYAREAHDLGTTIIPKLEISSRFRDAGICDRVLSALSAFEIHAQEVWPFLPGSHSWLELEITGSVFSSGLKDTIFVNRPVRLTSLGRENITMSDLSSRISRKGNVLSGFSQGWSIQELDETVVPLDEPELQAYKNLEISLEEVVDLLLQKNECPLGFYMHLNIGKIRVATGKRPIPPPPNKLPIPIAGVVK